YAAGENAKHPACDRFTFFVSHVSVLHWKRREAAPILALLSSRPGLPAARPSQAIYPAWPPPRLPGVQLYTCPLCAGNELPREESSGPAEGSVFWPHPANCNRTESTPNRRA